MPTPGSYRGDVQGKRYVGGAIECPPFRGLPFRELSGPQPHPSVFLHPSEALVHVAVYVKPPDPCCQLLERLPRPRFVSETHRDIAMRLVRDEEAELGFLAGDDADVYVQRSGETRVLGLPG